MQRRSAIPTRFKTVWHWAEAAIVSLGFTMRLHQHSLFLAVAYGVAAVAGFSCQAFAQLNPIVRPIVVGTLVGQTTDAKGQRCVYVEDERAGQVITRDGGVLNGVTSRKGPLRTLRRGDR